MSTEHSLGAITDTDLIDWLNAFHGLDNCPLVITENGDFLMDDLREAIVRAMREYHD